MVELGVGPLPAHFFVLYFGLLSMITPPVALAAFAAASISGAGAMRTAVESVRFGWIAFLMPFVFVYRPEFLMLGDAWRIVALTAFSLIATPLATAAIIGYGRRNLGVVERIAAAVLAAAALIPLAGTEFSFTVSAVSAGLGIALIVAHVRSAAAKTAKAT